METFARRNKVLTIGNLFVFNKKKTYFCGSLGNIVMEKESKQKYTYISRENINDLITEMNERDIAKKDIVSLNVRGSSFYLIYVK